MKKLILLSLLAVGITAFAQENENKRPRGEKFESLTTEQKVEMQVKKMAKDLDLKENQVKEVRILVTEEVEKREKRRAEMEAAKEQDRKEKFAKMKEEQAALETQMKKILTPEQFEKWQKIREERKANLKEKMAERRGKREVKDLPKAK